MSFKQLKNIGKRTKYTVYGWIRNKEKELPNIPCMVTSICILYFRKDEIFEIVAQGFKLSDNKKCIKRDYSERGWVALWCGHPINFGSIIISSNNPVIYEWILRIANPEKQENGIEVGITSKPIGDNIYSFCNWGEIKAQKYGNKDAVNNGEIMIHLDLKKGKIKFSINGIDQGVAYSNIEQSDTINYRLFAGMFRDGSTVEIVKFQEK